MASALQTQAKALMSQHRWSAAVPLLIKDCLQHPDDGWTCLYLGSCYYELRELEDANKCFAQAAELMPTQATPIGCLGDVALLNDDLEQAGKLYQQALAMNPDNRVALSGFERWKAITGQA